MHKRGLMAVAAGGMALGALGTAAMAQFGKAIAPLGGKMQVDPARLKALVALAPNLKPAPDLTRAQYVDHLRKAFDKRDTNQDMLVSWQKPGSGETLPAFQKCVVVQYKSTPASTVKDPAHPGQFITTPAATAPVDWEYFLDRLAKTSFEGGKCEAVKITTVEQCVIGGQAVDSLTLGGWMLADITSKSPVCSVYPKTAGCATKGVKQLCEEHKGEYAKLDKQTGCEKYTTYGPDSREALVRVAQASFDAEDWNKNGKIDGSEGAFLCPAS